MGGPRREALSSRFAGRLEGYITYKKERLNHKATSEEECYAPSFDRFCRDRFPDKRALDRELAFAWLSEGEGPTGNTNRASFLRGFARYLLLEGEDAFVLPGKVSPVAKRSPAPHIFTQKELEAFFAAADTIEPYPTAAPRHIMAPVYFRLLYCTGMRPYEARTLSVDRFDLDFGVIRVLDSKGRDRDVPLKPDVTRLCREYSERMEILFPGRTAFFPDRTGTAFWPAIGMRSTFRQCWNRAGITEFSGPRPIPYSFRHTFATECIRRWRNEGVDVAANIRFLQEYMGHDKIESTMYYVHLVRGGLGDPTSYETWEPSNRIREEGLYG